MAVFIYLSIYLSIYISFYFYLSIYLGGTAVDNEEGRNSDPEPEVVSKGKSQICPSSN